MSSKFVVGDLVRLYDPMDKDRNLGVVVDISPRKVHLVSHGATVVVQVYWPKIQETDWEYDFFLKNLKSQT